MADDTVCKKCGASWIVPKKLKEVLSEAQSRQSKAYGELLTLCPKCRPQAFAERTIGKELKRVARDWPLAQRRVEERKTVKSDKRTGATVYKSQCYICNSGCDTLVYEKDGKVIRVEGDPSSPITKGTLCCKGLASKEQLYHKDRILYPMKRIGKRAKAAGRGSPGMRPWTRQLSDSRKLRKSSDRRASCLPRAPNGGHGLIT